MNGILKIDKIQLHPPPIRLYTNRYNIIEHGILPDYERFH